MAWRSWRLKHLAAVPITNGLGEKGEHDDPAWPRYIRTTDIAGPTDLRNDTFKSLPPDIASRAMLESGDLLMTAAGATIGKSFTFTEKYAACYAGYLVRFRPATQLVDGLFIAYWMQSAHYWAQVDARRVKSTIENFSASKYSELSLSLPPLSVQRAVAAYLDTETTRIDALIAKKRRLEGLVKQRLAAQIEQEIRALAVVWGEVPLKILVERVTVGIVITPAAWYVNDDSGVVALRGTNVGPNRLRMDDLVRISTEGHAVHAKSALRAGDVVVVRTGQAGAAAVVPSTLEGANCIDLILVRPGQLDAEFLQFVLNSDWTQKHISEHSVGTIQSHFNVGAMKGLPVPRAPKPIQQEATARLKRLTGQFDELSVRLSHQIELLQEHRQALITAAVTGELKISGVA